MEIAELEVKIISDAQKAADALDNLAESAKTLQNSIKIDTSSIAGLKDIKDLAQIDGKKLEAIGEGMSKLSEGFAQFRNVKMADVTRAGKAITSLNEVKADKIAEIGAAIQPLAKSLAELSGVQFDSRNVTNFLNALGRLSGTDTTALQNLDFSAVGRSIRQLTQELADAPKINQSVISMTSAVANLAKSGSNIPIVTQSLGSLGTGLKDFMNVMSSAPKISTNTIQFTQALGTLANAGAKAETTAKHLGTLAQELRSFMQVMSTAPRISANTVQMTTALANLANAGSRVGRSSTTLINGLSNTSKSMNKAATSAKGLARAFGKFYANWFLVIRGIKGIWKSIESSMDYIEVLNYFNAAFGQVAESAVDQWEKAGYDSAESYYNSFSQRAQQLTTKMTGFTISDSGMLEATGGKSLGINPKDLMNYQAMFAQMSNSMGVTAETSLKLSTALTEIGADLASVRNIKFDKVWTDMASGLAGMSRTLDKYGANIRNVNLQQKLNEIGIKASITALNQNEKALLRTIILLDSTRYAWGDLAETINSPANQLRLLEANFNNLARTIGNIFLPIVAKVLPYINALVSALQRLAQFIVKLLGFEGFDWGGASGTGGGFDELIGGAEDLEEGLDGASGAAKKLNKQIRAFDELNVITMPEETTGAGGGLGGGIDTGLLEGALDDILDEYQTAWDKAFDEMEERANQFADNVAKAFQTGGLFGVGRYLSESLTEAFNSIPWESIYEGARTFGTGLAEFLNGLITPDLFAAVGQTIAGALNTAIYSALSFAEDFNWQNFGASLAAGVNRFFETFDFVGLAETINTWIKGALTAAATFLEETDFEQIGRKIGEFLVALDFVDIIEKLAKVLWDTLKASFDLLKGLIEEAPLETAIIGAFAAFKFLGIGKAISSKIAQAIATKLGVAITENATIGSVFTSALGAKLSGALAASGGISGLLTLDMAALVGEGGFATLGLLAGGAIIGGITAAFVGWNFGQWLNEQITGEEIELTFTEQMTEIKNSFTDGSWKDALELWGNDIYDAFVQLGEDEEEIWNTTWDNIKTTATEKWEEIGEWFESTGIPDWWNNNIAPWFTKEKWNTLWENVKTSAVEKWGEITSWWAETGVPDWWNEHVAPWFTQEKWQELWENVKQGITTKWTEFTTWWEETGVPDWWDNNVAPWFTKEQWGEFGENIKSGLSEKWNNFSEWWENTGFYNWWNSKVVPWFQKEKWNFSGIKDGLTEAWNSAINSVKNIWNTFANWLNSKLSWTIPPITVAGQTIFSGATIDLGKIPTFAKGGLITKATIAEIGEKGKEAVLPLTNQLAMKNIANAISVPLTKSLQSINVNNYVAAKPPTLPYQNYASIRNQAEMQSSNYEYSQGYSSGTESIIYNATYRAVSSALSNNKYFRDLCDDVAAGHIIEMNDREVGYAVKKVADNHFNTTGEPYFAI